MAGITERRLYRPGSGESFWSTYPTLSRCGQRHWACTQRQRRPCLLGLGLPQHVTSRMLHLKSVGRNAAVAAASQPPQRPPQRPGLDGRKSHRPDSSWRSSEPQRRRSASRNLSPPPEPRRAPPPAGHLLSADWLLRCARRRTPPHRRPLLAPALGSRLPSRGWSSCRTAASPSVRSPGVGVSVGEAG